MDTVFIFSNHNLFVRVLFSAQNHLNTTNVNKKWMLLPMQETLLILNTTAVKENALRQTPDYIAPFKNNLCKLNPDVNTFKYNIYNHNILSKK